MRHIKLDLVEIVVPLYDRLSVDGMVNVLMNVEGVNLLVHLFQVAKNLDQLHPIP